MRRKVVANCAIRRCTNDRLTTQKSRENRDAGYPSVSAKADTEGTPA